MVCESVNPKIPYFNAPIYLENKVQTPEICRWAIYLTKGIDCNWKGRRSSGTHQSALLHDKAPRRNCGCVFQNRGQILHRGGQTATARKVGRKGFDADGRC